MDIAFEDFGEPRLEPRRDLIVAIGTVGALVRGLDRVGDLRRYAVAIVASEIHAGCGYHVPVLGIDAHGSAGARWPSCSSSIEMPSGERTNAMCPSRGGRVIVTPASISFWQSA